MPGQKVLSKWVWPSNRLRDRKGCRLDIYFVKREGKDEINELI
jgi:hypothetical protein